MKKYRFIALNFCLLAGLTAMVIFAMQPGSLPIVAESPPVIDDSYIDATIPTNEKIPKLRNTGVDWDSIAERVDSGQGNITVEEEAAFNELHVLRMNWVDQLDCTTETCVWVMKYPPHPYASIDKEELTELGYADPLAALFMGLRYGEEWTTEEADKAFWDEETFQTRYEERISLYVRAAALSGKTGPLMRLVGTGREGHARLGIPEPVRQIALLRIAEKLGDPRADWKAELERELTAFPPHELDRFEERLEGWYQYYMNSMAHVQQDVTGSDQIMEFANRENGQ